MTRQACHRPLTYREQALHINSALRGLPEDNSHYTTTGTRCLTTVTSDMNDHCLLRYIPHFKGSLQFDTLFDALL